MLQKKVCMLGTSAVGKTSLVRRFVHSVFSDRYLTTIGVKIDRKVVSLEDCKMSLVLWDVQGEDEFARILPSYIRGSAGCLFVADGTRHHTIGKALELSERVFSTVGKVPSLLLLNKADLETEWDVDDKTIESLRTQGWQVIETSAKRGSGVEDAFLTISDRMYRA